MLRNLLYSVDSEGHVIVRLYYFWELCRGVMLHIKVLNKFTMQLWSYYFRIKAAYSNSCEMQVYLLSLYILHFLPYTCTDARRETFRSRQLMVGGKSSVLQPDPPWSIELQNQYNKYCLNVTKRPLRRDRTETSPPPTTVQRPAAQGRPQKCHKGRWPLHYEAREQPPGPPEFFCPPTLRCSLGLAAAANAALPRRLFYVPPPVNSTYYDLEYLKKEGVLQDITLFKLLNVHFCLYRMTLEWWTVVGNILQCV